MIHHKGLQSVLHYFEIKNGKMVFGNKTAAQIAAETGTPLYLYDLNVAHRKIRKLRASLPEEVSVHYAVKANPHPDIIRFFCEHADGVDIASEGELRLALEAGVHPANIGFAGPGKLDKEIHAACIAGIGSLNAESVRELERADKIAGRLGKPLNVSIRINPAYALIGSGMRMGGGPKQFGIDQEKVPDVLQKFDKWTNLTFVGFHVFAGSQNLQAEAVKESFDQALAVVETLIPYCPNIPQKINIGGGFGIPYYAGDTEIDIQTIGSELKKSLQKHKKSFQDMEIIVETGRYLIGESGVYICRVIDKKESRGETFLVLDGGMHHNLSASGNFGQILKRNFPLVLPEKVDHEAGCTVNVVGPLCTPLDKLGTKVSCPKVQEGDLVALMSSGAYGFSASPVNFLSHPVPKEIIIQKGTHHV